MVLLLPLFAAKKMKDSVGESAKRFTYSNIEQSVTRGIQGLYSILHSNPLDKKLSELNSRLIAGSSLGRRVASASARLWEERAAT